MPDSDLVELAQQLRVDSVRAAAAAGAISEDELSGTPDELLAAAGIDAAAIVEAVRSLPVRS